MKKALSIAAVILTAIIAAGCVRTHEVSMYDLSRAMLGATDFEKMSYVSSSDDDPEDLLSNVSDFEYGKVKSFFIAYAENGKGNADEIVVIAVSDPADVEGAASSLRAHLETRRAIYATYDPTQSDKLEDGLVFTYGNFAVLAVSGDNRAVKAAFEKFITDSGK